MNGYDNCSVATPHMRVITLRHASNIQPHRPCRTSWGVANSGWNESARQAIGTLIETHGGEIRTQTCVDRILKAKGAVSGVELSDGSKIQSSIVVFNGDINALGQDRLGLGRVKGIDPLRPDERSLSAVTLCCLAEVGQCPLIHHNVFFSSDYRTEFNTIDNDGQLPKDPTVYICAQDRGDDDSARDRERLLLLINAPGRADVHSIGQEELNACLDDAGMKLSGMGLTIKTHGMVVRGPDQWNTPFRAAAGRSTEQQQDGGIQP